MSRMDQIVIDLLDALSESWMEQHSMIEIGSDPDKIRLLREANEAVSPTTIAVPEGVKELYRGVFKRDVWDSC